MSVDRQACEACGKPFPAHKLKKRPRFCNHQCLSAWYNAKFEGIDHLLIEAYESGCSTKEIAKRFNLSYTQVRRRLLKLGVTFRTVAQAAKLAAPKISKIHKGKKHRPHTEEAKKKMSLAKTGKGKGQTRKPSGYIAITMGSNKGRSLHDVIVEQRIGRRLLPNEIVHHDDEDRGNNDPSNLILMTRTEHARLHRRRRAERRLKDQLTLKLTP